MIFEIRNFTYYSTEDLRALLEAIETAIKAEGMPVNRRLINSWRPRDGRVSSVITFKDFGTKKMHLFSRVYDQRAGCYHTKKTRYLVKQNTRSDGVNEIRIVPPKRFWGTPLERLAACGGNGTLVLPEDGRMQLINRLVKFYAPLVGRSLPAPGLDVQHDLQVRIMDTRGRVMDRPERVRIARQDARRMWLDTRYGMVKLDLHMERLIRRHRSAVNRLKRSRVPLTALEEEADEAIIVAAAALARAKEALTNLRADASNNVTGS